MPDPRIVAGMYNVLRGPQSEGIFEGFKSVLPGRERWTETKCPRCGRRLDPDESPVIRVRGRQ